MVGKAFASERTNSATGLTLNLAPAGVHGSLHPQGELETGRAAARADTVLVIASAHGRPIEEIVKVAGQPPWYQGLTWKDVAWLRSIVGIPVVLKGILS
jgi:isopentenyl diphosphate isomerase/L-lactate dehydrogenase-like FMN-dependent dehydrogenase